MGLLNHNNRPLQSIENISAPNGKVQMFQQLKNVMNMVQTAQNPNFVLQQIAQSNPQFATVMQMCNGKNPQEVFYAMCKQQGVDPNTILNQLR